MRLPLPWLDVAVAGVDAPFDRELPRATAKFAAGTTVTSHEVVLSARCETLPDEAVAPDASVASNLRYQFVRGRADARRSTFAADDGSVATIDHIQGRVDLQVRPSVFTAPHSTWSDLVAAPLAEHWRALGCYPLHAAAVSIDVAQILVCGESGCGKTTMSLALVSAGGVWRADDKVLIRCGADDLDAVSLYRNTNLAPLTIQHHAGLAFALDRAPINETNDKRPCDLAALGLPIDLTPFVPTSIVFPVRGSGTRSTWRRLRADETLIRLSAQSPSSPVRERLRAQHAVLATLARRSPAWEVEAGRDLLDSPAAVAARLSDTIIRLERAGRTT